jgi:hypothetical protein
MMADNAASLRAGRHPAWRQPPAFHELFFDAALDGLASHDAAQHAVRLVQQVLPMQIPEVVDVFEHHGTVRQQGRPWRAMGIKAPFQTGVTDIDDQKRHA